MEVTDSVDLGDGHTIEFGKSTWNPEETSVRDRYPTSTGGFSPHSSSEIPLNDFEPMVIEIAKRGLLDASQCASLISALANSLHRQLCP